MNARKTGCTDRKQTDHTGKNIYIIEVRERQMNLPPSETGMQVSIEKARGSQQANREQQDVATKQNASRRVCSRNMQTCASNPNPKYIIFRIYYTIY
jgi:hypothetical protein